MPAGDYLVRGLDERTRRLIDQYLKGKLKAVAGGGYSVAPTSGGVTAHGIGASVHTGFPGDATLFLNGNRAFSDPLAGRSYAETIGDGIANTFVVTHGLNSLDVIVQLVRVADGVTIHENGVTITVTRSDVNEVTVDFVGAPPDADEYRVLVLLV